MIDLVLNHRSLFRLLIAISLGMLGGCAMSSAAPDSNPAPAPRRPGQAPATRSADAEAHPISPRIDTPDGREIGRSRNGRPIVLREFGHASEDPATTVLLFAGIHGDEPAGVYAAAKLIELLDRDRSLLPKGIRLLIVPLANPDGYEVKTRQNSKGIDLNRNFPAKNFRSTSGGPKYQPGSAPLSEPESRVLYDLVLREKPARILSLHSIKFPKHGVNYDGPARSLADLIASKNRYKVLDTMGYPTPGSFGSWAGIDLQIPTITLEFPSNASGPAAWAANREALLAFIRGN